MLLTLLGSCAATSLLTQESFSPEEFSEKEKTALRTAGKAEKKLSVYLKVTSHRLKKLKALSQKCSTHLATRYLKGYQMALNRADDLVSTVDPGKKNTRKLLDTLLKFTNKINSSLIYNLEKVPQECRPLIQSALEVSQRVSNAVEVQLLRASNL